MLIEPASEITSYVEDCEICCRPINVEYVFSNSLPLNFNAFSTDENFYH
tara:strand:+ start:1068 stop:1214 length:147 start_codon:yes stop_codon:yes gene_type:complete